MPKLLAAFLGICLAGHVYLGMQLGLSVDEAHYALYALHPALSYFDHPPLVGWLQIPFVWLGGTDWLMRVVPLALWGLTAWMLWRFSAWAFILLLLSPVHQLLGLALIPDTLLLPLTLWVMWLTYKLAHDISHKPYWIGLGIALGLAGLSKYSGIFLAFGAAIALFATHGTKLLRERGLWFAVLIAAILVSPVLIWNAQHDWVSFNYQVQHASGNQEWQLVNTLKFDLVQLLAYGVLPLFGLFFVQDKALLRLCLAFALPQFILVVLSAGRGSALPHWTAFAWLALLPASAQGVQHVWAHGQAIWRWLIGALTTLQALCIVALAFAMAVGGQLEGQIQTSNPFADLHDWREASQKAQALQKEHLASALAVSNWTLASRLAWYSRSKVWALDGKNKQFEMWFGNLEYGQSYIWVDWSQMPMPKPVGCQKLEANTYQGQYSHFDFYKCGRV